MVGKANGDECLAKLNEVRVYAYNGNAAENFQIYHPNPAVSAQAARRLHAGDGRLASPA